MAAAQSTPTPFAVATLRSRKRPSGTSGDGTRASMTRKSPSSAAAAASRPIVSRRRPAGLVPVHDRVDGEHQRGGHRHRAGHVEASGRGRATRGRQQLHGEDEDGDADRDVDEEDPVPVEDVGQDPAEQHADASAAGDDEAEDAHRLRPLGRLREQVHDQRQRDRRDDRAAEPLHRPCADQHPLRRWPGRTRATPA